MLSKRLAAIMDLIPQCNIVADIGCDHAYLAIELIQSQRAKHVLAIDNKPGPLDKAFNNVKKMQLTDSIACVLSDGLQNINQTIDVIVIAGMGFTTAIDILKKRPDLTTKAQAIVLESNKNFKYVRQWLLQQSYPILEEQLTFDGHYYYAVKFVAKKDENLVYDDFDLEFGPLLRQRNDIVFQQYLNDLYTKTKNYHHKHPLPKHQRLLTMIDTHRNQK